MCFLLSQLQHFKTIALLRRFCLAIGFPAAGEDSFNSAFCRRFFDGSHGQKPMALDATSNAKKTGCNFPWELGKGRTWAPKWHGLCVYTYIVIKKYIYNASYAFTYIYIIYICTYWYIWYTIKYICAYMYIFKYMIWVRVYIYMYLQA